MNHHTLLAEIVLLIDRANKVDTIQHLIQPPKPDDLLGSIVAMLTELNALRESKGVDAVMGECEHCAKIAGALKPFFDAYEALQKKFTHPENIADGYQIVVRIKDLRRAHRAFLHHEAPNDSTGMVKHIEPDDQMPGMDDE